MILFIASGRLGNQLFQYAFLKSIKKSDERIIVFGFDELIEVFPIDDVINLKNYNRIIRAFNRKILAPLLSFFLSFLVTLKIISCIYVKKEEIGKHKREKLEYIKENGLLNFITFVKTGHFQSEFFFKESIIDKFNIRETFENSADFFFNDIPKESYKVFIHIRNEDYKSFFVYDKSTLLPLSYYHDLISWFMKNKEKVFFVFLSDEPSLLEKQFRYLYNKKVSFNNSFGIDLAIMTKCQGAILSPSSFGWWGSYLMKNRDIVFAPEHWLGFASECDYPNPEPVASYMRKIKVVHKEHGKHAD